MFPLSPDALWRLLHAHLDDLRIHEIHPWILESRTVRDGDPLEFGGRSFPREKVVERVVKVAGRRSRTTWHYRIEPPQRYDYEAVFENGSRTLFENAYSAAAGGTLVRTTGEVSIRGVPSFLVMRIVRRSLDRSDEEDLAYARRVHV